MLNIPQLLKLTTVISLMLAAVLTAQAIYFPDSFPSPLIESSNKVVHEIPSWNYHGFGCKADKTGIQFKVASKSCSFSSQDSKGDRLDCHGNDLTCTGQFCPSRACGIAAMVAASKDTKSKKIDPLVHKSALGFRPMEPRMVKQPGSIPPIRMKSGGARSPFK